MDRSVCWSKACSFSVLAASLIFWPTLTGVSGLTRAMISVGPDLHVEVDLVPDRLDHFDHRLEVAGGGILRGGPRAASSGPDPHGHCFVFVAASAFALVEGPVD